jgi:mitogen-activated protein kinase kinase kinase
MEINPTSKSNESNTASYPPTFKWIKGQEIKTDPKARSDVFLGMNMVTGELMAVKQLQHSAESSAERQLPQKVEIEIDILRRLQHHNIITYLGYEQKEQIVSIFYEYIAGGSIAHLLRSSKRIEESLVRSFTRQILSGVVYLHDQMIIHQNLKCDNILLDGDGTCKISGFGSAKQTDGIYQNDPSNSTQCSIFWSAPEVLESHGCGYSGKFDIWSLGCCTLEMFSGERPWSKLDENGAADKLRRLQGPDISEELVQEISPQALSFMLNCFTMYVVLVVVVLLTSKTERLC